jgi:Asp/Glu/hydantoin racemase
MPTQLLLINPTTAAAVTQAMRDIAAEAAPAGVEICACTAAFGSALITDETALARAGEAVLAALAATPLQGIAGVIVSAFGDPGLLAARQRLTLPVTGIAEAGMAEAARGGRRFAVVTTTPGLATAITATARAYGHVASFSGVRLTPGEPAQLMQQPQALLDALERACDEAVRLDGAQAVVIGGGPLAKAARALRSRVAVPLIEPVPAAVRLALARAGLGAGPGLSA